MGQRFSGPPPAGQDPYSKNRPKKPQGLRDLPRYLREVICGFFSRLGYIFAMVWQTGHWILFAMILVSILTGILPLVGSLLSREILNELQGIVTERATVELSGSAFTTVFWGSMVMLLLIF